MIPTTIAHLSRIGRDEVNGAGVMVEDVDDEVALVDGALEADDCEEDEVEEDGDVLVEPCANNCGDA